MKSCLRKNNLKQKHCQCGVKFDTTNITIRTIEHHRDLPCDVSEALWWSRAEIKELKKENTAIINQMIQNNGFMEDTEDLTCRGLECRTPTGAKTRFRERTKARHSVLDEQDIQRDEGIPDPDFIANLYREITKTCAVEALNRGMKDQLAMMESLDPASQMEIELRLKRKAEEMALIPHPSRRSILPEGVHSNEMQSLKLIGNP